MSCGRGTTPVSRDHRDGVIEALAASEHRLARQVAIFRETLSVALSLLHHRTCERDTARARVITLTNEIRELRRG